MTFTLRSGDHLSTGDASCDSTSGTALVFPTVQVSITVQWIHATKYHLKEPESGTVYDGGCVDVDAGMPGGGQVGHLDGVRSR